MARVLEIDNVVKERELGGFTALVQVPAQLYEAIIMAVKKTGRSAT